MACDLGDVDNIVIDYLKSMLHINKADTGNKLLGIRDHPTFREVDMAFKAFVPYLHPDKQHFIKWLEEQYPGLTVEGIAACKNILKDFFSIWTKTKEDLKAHDKGMATQARCAKLNAC